MKCTSDLIMQLSCQGALLSVITDHLVHCLGRQAAHLMPASSSPRQLRAISGSSTATLGCSGSTRAALSPGRAVSSTANSPLGLNQPPAPPRQGRSSVECYMSLGHTVTKLGDKQCWGQQAGSAVSNRTATNSRQEMTGILQAAHQA